jgi:SAM-dependent methyltransferase
VRDRRDLLLDGIDVAVARGLEMGPLTNPVVPRSSGPVEYLDRDDTEALRERYRVHADVDVDEIVHVDHVVTSTVREAVGDSAPYDYVVASHVIEHVPDLVAWLDDLRSVLVTGGVLSLAIPDHRRCFDALRTPTVTADVVEAHLAGRRVPSPRQAYDYLANAVAWQGHIIWAHDAPLDELTFLHEEGDALGLARRVQELGEYHDMHCWVFTPESFVALIAALRRLRLVAFEVAACSDVLGGEFVAQLRAIDPDTEPEPSDRMRRAITGPGPAERRSPSESAAVIDALEARVVALERQLDAVYGTVSWRITRPLRAARRRRPRSIGR